MTLHRRSLVALFTLLAASIPAQAQVPLGSGTYTQTFDSMSAPTPGPVAALPAGWSVYTGATSSSLGTLGVTTPAAATWGSTMGQWQNSASATGMTGTETTAVQNSSTNRALAIRQSTAFGDPGAAAAFYFSTVGQQVTSISFSAQLLSPQPRVTSWLLQYGIGAVPGSWNTVGSFASDGTTFGATTVTAAGFGSILDNQNNVWLRVVTLASTTLSGNRDTFGIDNFTIVTSATSSGTPPSIGTPPPASQTVTEGQNAQFTVTAGGDAPLSYQWRKTTPSITLLNDTGNITGSHTSTLKLTGVAVADGGNYDVVVTNVAGSATSPAATLTVNPLLVPPNITTQPVSQAVAIGGTANFTVTATGTAPLFYQWRKGGVPLADSATIVGATTASLTISSVTADVADAYDVVVSNGINPDATSNTAALSVPAIITPSSPIAYTSQIAYIGGTYAQSFDTLPASGTFTLTSNGPLGLNATPISAPGLGGWSLVKYDGTGSVALFRAESGSGNSGSVYSFGMGTTADRALGSLSSASTISRFGATIVNSTGQTITQFTVAYTGEQWRRGTGGANKLAFEYAFDPINLNVGTFTAASALDLISPVTTGSATALNGDLPANRTAVAATLTGLNWAPGQVLVLRWTDIDDGGGDDGLAIDNFTFTTPVATTAILPAVIYTVPAANAVNVATNATVSVTFNEAVNFTTSSFTLAAETSGSHLATLSGGQQTYTLTPNVPFNEGEDATFTILASQVTDAATGTQHLAADFTTSFITFSSTPLPIHKIQGSGLTSIYAGYPATVQGVVVASFQGANQVGGFYLEAPDAQHDANPATSEGILVFDDTNSVTVGDLVTVTGTVTEYGDTPVSGTEIIALTAFSKDGTKPLPAALPVTLPFPSAGYAERYEGMRVTLPQTLTVTDNYDLGIFGNLVISNGRLATPTNVVAPGGPAQALAAANQLNQITLDDGLDGTFPDPTPYLNSANPATATRRAGSTVTGIAGILDNKFGGYIIEPTAAVTFTEANPRGNPPAVGGTLKVAIGNVLNYFNGNGSGAADPLVAGYLPRLHQRGANNQDEFLRQRTKIIAGITALAPDIMGLTEVENDRVTNVLTDSYGPTSAIRDLVAGLNAAAPVGTHYDFINMGTADIVTDDIHCAFIYRIETVAPVGSPAMLNDPAFNNVARNPLAQTFRQLSNNEKLTVCINHFKSKGSAAAYPSFALNEDQGDGQGESNHLRTLQAQALVTWLATDPTTSGDPDFLIIGDLNAAAKEDPIVAIESAGYINLTEAAEGVGGYSYTFGGEFGHLDHALANGHLAGQVVDAATWHVNSDEPIYYDYNTENKTVAQLAINAGGPYRYSDHDPVVVGLNLQPPAANVTASLQITRGSLALNRKTGRFGQTVTIKNTSVQAIAAPLSFVITQLSANGTAYAPTSYTSMVPPLGSPYYNVNVGADNLLTPNETVTVFIEYTNSNNQPITYVPKVLGGPGGR